MKTYYQENEDGVCGNCGLADWVHKQMECPGPDEIAYWRERHETNMALIGQRHAELMQAEWEKRWVPVFWIIVGFLVFITMCMSARGDVADDILAVRTKEKSYNAKNNVIDYATPGEEATPKPKKYTDSQIKYYTEIAHQIT